MEIKKVCVVGLGYVGLPLAVELSKHFDVVGVDVNEVRISELNKFVDSSGEVASAELKNAKIVITSAVDKIAGTEVIIACVPTPISEEKVPDLSFLKKVSKTIGENMSARAIVVYESTVYPGVTEEVCVPILEKSSGMKCGKEFKVGYSPERMNPGDKEHSIKNIIKVVAGMDQDALSAIDYVYGKITTTHCAANIRVAEAAKVIENIQRDLNIALMNELAIIFDKMDIDVGAVLESAGTKWNFHKYSPGLVGGHCIGVDPYYLTYKAEQLGYTPEVILAGRKINDEMHSYYSGKIMKIFEKTGGKKVYLLGLTFKPNVADFRNSRVKHLIKDLINYGIEVCAFDPYLTKEVVEENFAVKYVEPDTENFKADLIVMATAHDKILNLIKEGRFSSKVLSLEEL
jgi:UDP-N-acetyl-D-glucosamine/UDP-N-acetyl-D-galactosamine dehydrogenase